jgi:hypothetical protein
LFTNSGLQVKLPNRDHKSVRPGGSDFSYAHAPPYRRGFDFRIAARQQQLRLMSAQASACLRTHWPPAEPSFGQALGGQPESLAIVARIRIARALRLRKMNRQPENGSEFNFSRQSCARASAYSRLVLRAYEMKMG